MTIKNLALSSVAALAITTSAFAGTVTVTSQSVGAESVAADRYFNNIDLNVSYAASINGTLNQGSVIYTISNAELNSTEVTGSNLAVYNNSLEITSSCEAGSAGRIICDINGTITDGDTLILTDGTATAGTPIDVNTSAGYTGSTVAVSITNSATTTVDSGTAKNWLTTVTEWTASSTGFSNQIDASNNFLSFTSSSDSNASVKITQSAPDIASPATTVNWSVLPDQNTSAFGTMNMTSGATQGIDNNYTSGFSVINGTTTLYADFTPDATNAIQEAVFTTGLTLTVNGKTSNLIASGSDFGAFTTYGYTAQIPGASYSSAAQTDTIISLVNTGSSDTTDVVVVLQDLSGNSCTLTSASDSELTRPTSGTTTKVRLSSLLDNSKCSSLTGTGYAIELSVPTTPTNIYANAFVRNSAIDQFKVLPVYNNGNNY